MSVADYSSAPSGGKFEQQFKQWFVEPDEKVLFRSERHGLYVRLDDRPVTVGHSLVVPIEGRRFVDDLDPSRHDKLWTVARHLGNQLLDVYRDNQPEYIGTLVAGKAVHHAHVHRAVCYEGRDWISGFGGQPRLTLTNYEWARTIDDLAFSPDMTRRLETDLDRIAAPEAIIAAELDAYTGPANL